MNDPPKKKKPNQCHMLKVNTDWLKKCSPYGEWRKFTKNKSELHIVHKNWI